jgi:2-polyprenyl-6-methoxyphenol hydroxylase-like FAD-dependent oxidoreductase
VALDAKGDSMSQAGGGDRSARPAGESAGWAGWFKRLVGGSGGPDTQKSRPDVLISGAGPVGLTTALALARNGLRVRIVDKERDPSLHGYAVILHPATIGVLRRLGLAEPLLPLGHRIKRFELYADGEQQARLDLAAVGEQDGFALVLPQRELEDELRRQLEAFGARVDWHHRLASFRTETEAVEAVIEKLDRTSVGYPVARSSGIVVSEETCRARYLVGADGYHSLVRRRMEWDYAERGLSEVFSIYEVDAPPEDPDCMTVWWTEEGVGALIPRGPLRARWCFQIERPEDHDPSLEALKRLAERRAPWLRIPDGVVRWSTEVRFERRLAERFGEGPVWLAGDAAHITGPLTAQSLNAGLGDAVSLAEAIAPTIQGDAGADNLEQYARRAADWELAHGAPEALPEGESWVARNAAAVVPVLPGFGRSLETMLSKIV